MGYFIMSIQDQETNHLLALRKNERKKEKKQLLLKVAVIRAKADETKKDLIRCKEHVERLMKTYQIMKARMRRTYIAARISKKPFLGKEDEYSKEFTIGVRKYLKRLEKEVNEVNEIIWPKIWEKEEIVKRTEERMEEIICKLG
jgi:hypothetical protein